MNPGSLPFLKQVSDHLKQTNGEDLHTVAVVFPNRRAGLYFRKYLAEGIQRPIFSPVIFSIEDLILSLSRKKIGGNHQLLLILYGVYQSLEKENARTLDDFLNWAPVMIEDFNEIDLYLADPEAIFTYLSAARKITQWSPDGKALTEFQKSYLHFFNSIKDYYRGFHASLSQNHLASQGSAYRYVAENLGVLLPDLPWKKIIFAGFNALTAAEEKIILQLREAGIAEIFWDSDEYYVNNPIQEAGSFLRKYKNKAELGPMRWISNQYKTEAKSIRILGIPLHIGQAKVAGQLLSSVPAAEWPETALVLADETMLIPMLNSIPETVSDFNVTMGLPLRLTPVNGLFDALFQLHLRTNSLNQGKDKSARAFYFKDLLSLFRHPWLSELLDANHSNAGYDLSEKGSGLKQREEILISRSFFSHSQLILDIVKPAILDTFPIDFLFDDYSEKPLELLTVCQRLCGYLKDQRLFQDHINKEVSSGKELELEYLYSYSLLFSQVKETWELASIPVSLPSLYKLFRQSVSAIKLSFYGEPLKGLQVMGMLETRNLDFKNIIMLHVNDDILPAGKSHNSFIPIDIKDYFKLPTYRDRQAVFAYHFYRLLQRAENVHLLYNTEPGQMAGGEKSRFIHQLIRELKLYNPRIEIKEEVISFPTVEDHSVLPILIKKDAGVLAKIKLLNIKGWSASSLNTYRSCKLKFYFSKVAGIEETEEAEESMDAATLGKAFHSTLELLFKPYIGKALTAQSYTEMLQQLPIIIPTVFKTKTDNGEIEYGKNFLLLKVAESVLGRYLEKEKENAENEAKEGNIYQVVALEKWMNLEIPPYKFIGIADRIDKSGGIYRILDYKSGKVQESELSLPNIEKLYKEEGSDKIFQLLFYAYLFYHQMKPPPTGIFTGIVAMRRPEKAFMSLKLPKGMELITEGFEIFKDLLISTVDEIYNQEIAFTQTDNIKTCDNCTYKQICIR